MTTFEEEALHQRRKWIDGAIAEYLGFCAAEHEPSPRIVSTDTYIQERYDRGFIERKAIRQQSEVKV